MKPISCQHFWKASKACPQKINIVHCKVRKTQNWALEQVYNGRSITTATIQSAEDVFDYIEKIHCVTIFILDFGKAFYCLEHDLVLCKLSKVVNARTSDIDSLQMKCRKAEYCKLLIFADGTTLFLAEKSAGKVAIPFYTDKTVYQTSHENDLPVTVSKTKLTV